ncbi:GNAT family N-acetyltransferase [Salisaeta longa]|uniref:GNAT family N-acetyltransferase n=1 Tax=Salisaeta longa TaxID=503170 RepID=UPI00040283E2|nr:N-acetyltransferase [Salisaeta longa]
MPPPLSIRAATLDDLDTLVAFNQAMAAETEDKPLDAERLRAGVRAVLTDEAKGRYLLAQRGGRVVGGLLLTTEWSDWRNGQFWWIQSVYVRPEARRQGVYAALYAYVVSAARAAPDVCGLRLYVEKTNDTARATYGALGMRETSYRFYERTFAPADDN